MRKCHTNELNQNSYFPENAADLTRDKQNSDNENVFGRRDEPGPGHQRGRCPAPRGLRHALATPNLATGQLHSRRPGSKRAQSLARGRGARLVPSPKLRPCELSRFGENDFFLFRDLELLQLILDSKLALIEVSQGKLARIGLLYHNATVADNSSHSFEGTSMGMESDLTCNVAN